LPSSRGPLPRTKFCAPRVLASTAPTAPSATAATSSRVVSMLGRHVLSRALYVFVHYSASVDTPRDSPVRLDAIGDLHEVPGLQHRCMLFVADPGHGYGVHAVGWRSRRHGDVWVRRGRELFRSDSGYLSAHGSHIQITCKAC
jgi:hypothetical protein